MAAAALAQRHSKGRSDGLHPTHFGRDLGQIADLIEICFAAQMDSGGRSAINEMKIISRLGPLAWLLALIDRYVAGLGSGFVWRSDGRVIGNVSLYRAGSHPYLGPGWMIANVSVHPDFRRQGIARAMMEATIDRVRRSGGGWIALQVDADNEAAVTLYDRLDFQRHETLAQWDTPAFYALENAGALSHWPIRPRRWSDAPAEADLIFNRARVGGMAWTQPIEKALVAGSPFDLAELFLGGGLRDRWVLADPDREDRLLGAIWLEPSGWRHARVTHFLDPSVSDVEGRRALLGGVFSQPYLEGWSLRVEVTDGDEVISGLLGQFGFRKLRTLLQMRLRPGAA